jgi:hypothetical protein
MLTGAETNLASAQSTFAWTIKFHGCVDQNETPEKDRIMDASHC